MNITVRPDTSGAAPACAAYTAVDDDTYDGAPDAGACNIIGHGPTPDLAIEDLLAQMDEGERWQREDARDYRFNNGAFGVRF